uniref:Reverse transcriptase domain-containing protein n=1 Tax=Anolis carolinensis TaxID=28377 RepID=A0A803TK04_ANOCA
MTQIEETEKRLKANPKDQKLLNELILNQKRRENLELGKRANQLKYIKQSHFENANKPGRWLSRRLRKKKEATYINRIKVGAEYFTSEEDIKKQFKEFYSQLYENDQIKKDKINIYLGKSKLQKISEEDREALNKEISEKEIQKAIRKLDANKAPGPDGFSAIYYKTFEKELTPHLQKIMNSIREQQQMPKSWKEAQISVIHKDGTDSEDIRNYRPISLLNVDYKIFTSILAERLKNFLKNWIKDDQVGFLPNRHLKDNVRIILDLIEYYNINVGKEVLFLTIDAEKAFDRVNWDFFKLLIKELDIGYYFQNAIEAIYQDQTAKISINQQDTEKIRIRKGTRQGCPLSPLIFIMSLEILLNNIRENKDLKGTKIQGTSYKVRAYADDIVCIIEDPEKNSKKWFEVITEYGDVAGLRINTTKTKALPKNIVKEKQDQIANQLGIQITSKIKYLGINITAKNSQLLKNNYETNWKKIKKDLENWKTQKLSLLGRIAAVKMNILPRMLFLFQCLPILRSNKSFIDWKSDLSRFIWQGKKPRIKMKSLTDDKRRGGLAMPDLKMYYEANNLIWIKDWILLKNRKLLNLEGWDLSSGWHSYLWYEKTKKEKSFNNHFLRSSLIKTWSKYKLRMYNRTPRWLSPLEASQRRLLGWTDWPRYGEIIKKERQEHELLSQQEIKDKYSNITWLQYWQLKEFFNKDKSHGFMDKENKWDKVWISDNRTLSKIYKYLNEWNTETEIVKNCMTKWAKNIGRSILMAEWEDCWNRKIKFTYAYSMKENWWKMFYRWHFTPNKLGSINKNNSTKCWKCGETEGTYHHMWWTCRIAKEFWIKIHEYTQKILGKKLPKLPEIFLLNISRIQAGSNDEKILTFLSTAARIVFARYWRQSKGPTIEEWLIKVAEIKNMDRLTYLLAKQQGRPRKETDWNKVESFLNRKKIL